MPTSPADDRFPPVESSSFELRFTHRALVDLRARDASPADLAAVGRVTPWSSIVGEFFNQRTAQPTGTGGALSNVGRGDIEPLHGPAGGRAATWFDRGRSICWFLGFSPRHNYRLFEERAANGELMPSADDLRTIDRDQSQVDFGDRVVLGLHSLVRRAVQSPRAAQRGTVGSLLRLDLAAVVEVLDDRGLADLYVAVQLPVPIEGALRPPDWPGPRLIPRLAVLATGLPGPKLEVPATMPNGQVDRRINPSKELPFVVRDWEFPLVEVGSGFVSGHLPSGNRPEVDLWNPVHPDDIRKTQPRPWVDRLWRDDPLARALHMPVSPIRWTSSVAERVLEPRSPAVPRGRGEWMCGGVAR